MKIIIEDEQENSEKAEYCEILSIKEGHFMKENGIQSEYTLTF
ncbi:hypothetical protein [Leptotrichia massiliensis]|nr:hypothetical protein [Leptotrichia massiliensis]